MLNSVIDPRPRGSARGGSSGEDGSVEGLDLQRLIALFRRRLPLFLAVALVVFVGAVIVTVRATPMYTATSSLTIDTRSSNVVDAEAVLSGLPADSGVVDTEIEILKSRQLAERVVDTLNLDEDPEFNPALAEPGPLGAVIGGVAGLFGAAAPDAARERMSALDRQREKERVVGIVLGRLSVRRSGLTYVMNVSFTSSDAATASRIASTFAERYLLEQLEA